MHHCGFARLIRRPGHGPAQGPVDFESSPAIAKALHGAYDPRWHFRSGQKREVKSRRSDISQNGPGTNFSAVAGLYGHRAVLPDNNAIDMRTQLKVPGCLLEPSHQSASDRTSTIDRNAKAR